LKAVDQIEFAAIIKFKFREENIFDLPIPFDFFLALLLIQFKRKINSDGLKQSQNILEMKMLFLQHGLVLGSD
jgi:hypothetical protein